MQITGLRILQVTFADWQLCLIVSTPNGEQLILIANGFGGTNEAMNAANNFNNKTGYYLPVQY